MLKLKSAVLAAALAWPACAGYIIPATLQPSVQGTVSTDVPNFSGVATCYVGYSAGNPACSVSIASNRPTSPQVPTVGTSTGSLMAFVSSTGAHLVASASGSGDSDEQITADVGFGDNEVNQTSIDEFFQLTFHLDAELYTFSTAASQVHVSFSQAFNSTPLFDDDLGAGGPGTYVFVNRDIMTPLVKVSAHSSLQWFIDLNGFLSVYSGSSTIYPAGLPQGLVDAGNTLSFTNFAVFDASGNALPQSALTSTDGFTYTNSPTAPEPASAAMLAGAVAFLLIRARRRVR